MGHMTDERRLIQEAARAFAMKEVLPVANRLDPEKGDIPPELIRKLAEMGYFGIVIPEQHGGLGLGVFEYCLITEELARAWMSVASLIARGNGLSAGRGMTEAQRAVFLPRAARGEFLGAAAMSEPAVGSDLGAIACRARRDGDDTMPGLKHACPTVAACWSPATPRIFTSAPKSFFSVIPKSSAQSFTTGRRLAGMRRMSSSSWSQAFFSML